MRGLQFILKSTGVIGLSVLLTSCAQDNACKSSAMVGTWYEDLKDPKSGLTFDEDCSFRSNDCEGRGRFTSDTNAKSGETTFRIENWNATASSNGPMNCGDFDTGLYDCDFTVSGSKGSTQTLRFQCRELPSTGQTRK